MKKLFGIVVLIFMFSSLAFAEWKQFGEVESKKNGKYYVDTDSIIKESGYLYFWKMIGWEGPDEYGNQSVKVYIEGDCKVRRIKTLSYIFFTGRLGKGSSDQQEVANKDWKYPPPGSIDANLLRDLCK